MTDSNADNRQRLQAGISAVRARQLPEARALLRQVISAEPNNETAWLWLAAALDTTPERKAALERVLQINPANPSARRALNQLNDQVARSADQTAAPLSTSASPLATPALSDPLGIRDIPTAAPAPLNSILPPAPLPPSLANLPSDRTAGASNTRGQIPTALLLVLGVTVIVMLAAIVVVLVRTPDQTNPTGVAVVASATAQLDFIAIQQTHDAETLTPNAQGQPIITASKGLPPVWTLPPSDTPIPSNTPRPTATILTLTPLASPAPLTSPTTTATPLSSDALSVTFSQEVKNHPALRTLQQIHADGNQLAALTDSSTTAADPSWSTDGSQLAYVTQVNGTPQLAIAKADGSQAQVVTKLTGAYLRSPRWSPDGKQIAFAASLPAPDSDRDGLYVLQITDSTVNLLIDPRKADPQAPLYTIHDPAWSPDGKQIAFAASGFQFDVFRIAVFTLATQQHQTLTDGSVSAIQPAWSSVGNQIAFTAIRSGHAALMTMSADGSAPQVLTVDTPNSENRDPAWSPDGHWLAFSSNREGGFAIYVALDSPTGLVGLTQLTTPGQPAFTPAFRPGH